MFLYDRIMSFYLSHANNPERICEIVAKLFYRCLLTHDRLDSLRLIYRNYRKFKTTHEKLIEIGTELGKTNFDLTFVQSLCNFYIRQASRLVKRIDDFLDEEIQKD